MAFVRTKRVGEHEYRQLVENYRENGHHRQRVLAHLGRADTVEEAIEAARQKLADLDASRLAEQAQEAEQEAVLWEASIRREFGEQIERYHDGEIPTPAELARRIGEDKEAPVVRTEPEEFHGLRIERKVYAEVPVPTEVDEYCRAFGDGTVADLKDTWSKSPNEFGRTVYYPGLARYETRIDRLYYWHKRAEEKRTEYEHRRQYHRDRIEKLEQVARSLSGD